MDNQKFSGDGPFTQKTTKLLKELTAATSVHLTTSCTHALEMSALLADIKPGDEVIMPSFTFVSTANAFVLRGAKVIFTDIRSDTLNLDENRIHEGFSKKTRVIVPVHYGGVACEMDTINQFAKENNLLVIEDAAQCIDSWYKGNHLGTIGDFGSFSFHETKNLHCGEGGALLVKNPADVHRAEILREKGTDRARFFRGEIDKYSWVDLGSSYLPSELNAAFLLAQLEQVKVVTEARLKIWNHYHQRLEPLESMGFLQLPFLPLHCQHNAHLYQIRTADLAERTKLIDYLKAKNVYTVFHYVPLHSALAGKKYAEFRGEDKQTTSNSERLIRLPMFYGLTENEIDMVCEAIFAFYGK
jgi:dTDP-4-amino-4,6-dideoxygalactose transaminase